MYTEPMRVSPLLEGVCLRSTRVTDRVSCTGVQEDGVAEGVASFHRHLPVEDLTAGHPTVWHLAEPGITDVFSEMGTGVIGFFTHPYRAYKREGRSLG